MPAHFTATDVQPSTRFDEKTDQSGYGGDRRTLFLGDRDVIRWYDVQMASTTYICVEVFEPGAFGGSWREVAQFRTGVIEYSAFPVEALIESLADAVNTNDAFVLPNNRPRTR